MADFKRVGGGSFGVYAPVEKKKSSVGRVIVGVIILLVIISAFSKSKPTPATVAPHQPVLLR